MAVTEIIQTDLPFAPAQPTTPPITPNLPSSEQVVTLSNAQQFIEMVKAIVAIEIASTAKPPSSYTPPESPNLQSSTRPLTVKDLEQLFLKLIEKKSPDSAEIPETAQPNSLDQALVKLTQVLEKVDAMNKREDAKPEATKHVEAEKQKLRASKLEYKLVDEVYVTYSVATILLTSPVQLG